MTIYTRQIRLELDEIQKINHLAGKSGVRRQRNTLIKKY